ncbi:MAG: SH3 domain-containing protein [Caldilineaceae bacterium]|nr:SH3 domain-containing protein [Caldilineaceae bacterium]
MVRQLHRILSLLLVLLLLLGQALPTIAQDEPPAVPDGPPIRVSSATSVEEQLLGKMMVLMLQKAGYPVEDLTALDDAAAVRAALEAGEIDLYPEYTGTSLIAYNNLPVDALPNAANRAFELAKSLDAPRDLLWLDPADFNSSPALFVLDALDETIGTPLDTIAMLADYMNGANDPLTICVNSEFYGSADGLPGLQDLYGFTFPEENILLMDSDETYTNLVNGNCDVAQGMATDGRVAAWQLRSLEDTLDFFHFYQPAPVMRAELLDTYPDLPDVLNGVMGALDRETMTMLNAQVTLGADGLVESGDEEAVEDVVFQFLTRNNFIKPPAIRVGSKEFTEQLILGKLLVLLLRDAGYEVEDLTGFGGTPQIRAAVEAGELDIYPEYTGTATSVHHGIPVTALPTTAQRAFALARSLDAPAGLIWLDPLPFNNTYTLLVRQELFDSGIETLGDLAAYMNANDAPFTLCVESEFYVRPDGLPGLQELYGFAFREENIAVMETAATYAELRDGACDVAEGFATDGRINAWGLVGLEDTLAFFPFYNPAPVVRKEVLDLHPEISALINHLSALITNDVMIELNARVDIGADGELASGDEESIEDVAYSFLRANRLVALPEIAVSIANAEDGYYSLVSEMLMLLLADTGYQVVDKTDLGSGAIVRQAMLDGEVDLYVESVITALADYNNLPLAALPTTQDRAFALVQTLDEPNDIRWLGLMDYNEVYSIVTSDALADAEIASLDDFALYMIANDAPLTICMDSEFYASPFNGLTALETLYGFTFKPENIQLMDAEEIFAGLESGACEVAAASNLDAAARGYTVLADPLEFFLNFGSAPVIRKEVLEQNPELASLLANLTALLDEATIGELDRLIEMGPDGEEGTGDEAPVRETALTFLVNAGLIAPPAPDASEAAGADASAADAETAPEEAAPDEAAGGETSGETDSETTGEEPAPTEEGETGADAAPANGPSLSQTNPQPGTAAIPDALARLMAAPLTPIGQATATGSRQPVGRLTHTISNDLIHIGAMADTEQQLLARMISLLLVDGGYPVAETMAIGTSPDLRAMLQAGAIDIYPEFTGAALSLYHNIPLSALPTTAEGAFTLAQRLDETFSIFWFRKASFDSAYGMAVRADWAEQGMRSLFDVAAAVNGANSGTGEDLTFCVEEAFALDPELGLSSLSELYEFSLDSASVQTMPLDQIYGALRSGQCDVGEVLRTDGRVAAWNLSILTDSLGAFPNFTPAPTARRDLIVSYPELAEYLGQLGPRLEPAVMAALNAAVDLGPDGEPATGDEGQVTEVATRFLCEQQLITSCAEGTLAQETTLQESTTTPLFAALIPMTSTRELSVAVNLEEAATQADVSAITVSDSTTVADETELDAIGVSERITVTTSDTFGVNARAAANPTAEIIAVLPRNTAVAAVGRTADSSWLQIVLTDGQVAWVFAAAILTNSEVVQQLPVVGA